MYKDEVFYGVRRFFTREVVPGSVSCVNLKHKYILNLTTKGKGEVIIILKLNFVSTRMNEDKRKLK